MKTDTWGGAPINGRSTPKGVWNTVGMFRTFDLATRRREHELLEDGFFDLFAHEVSVQDRIRYACWDEEAGTWTNGFLIVTGNTHGKQPGVSGRVMVRLMTATETAGEGGATFSYHIGRGLYDVVRGERLAEGVTRDEAAAMTEAA
jgi:hypothetical protein